MLAPRRTALPHSRNQLARPAHLPLPVTSTLPLAARVISEGFLPARSALLQGPVEPVAGLAPPDRIRGMLLALAIVCAMLVGANLPFFGNVVANIMGLVGELGKNGLVGLIALGIILYLFAPRKMA